MIEKIVKGIAGRAANDFDPDTCAVATCHVEGDDVGVVKLKPLDPIDHDVTYAPLCPGHTKWAADRNELADIVLEQLRDARAEIAGRYSDDVAEVADPPDGELDEAAEIQMIEDAEELAMDIVGVEETIEP